MLKNVQKYYSFFNSKKLDKKVQWNTAPDAVWAMACDFPDTPFDSAKTEGRFCGPTCASNPRCTHFAWTDFQGGTCWLKSGQAKREDATPNDKPGMVCGIVDPGISKNECIRYLD